MSKFFKNPRTTIPGILIILYVGYCVFMEKEIDMVVVTVLSGVIGLLSGDGNRKIGDDNVPPNEEEEPPGIKTN